MDIDLANWLLSLFTFLCGTIVVPALQRLRHEGYSIRQPVDVRFIYQDPQNREQKEIFFCVLIKIANGSAKSLILDDIQATPIVSQNYKFEYLGVNVKKSDDGGIEFPPPDAGSGGDMFPFLIGADVERILAVGLVFKYTEIPNGDDSAHPIDELMAIANTQGVRVLIRDK